VGAGTLLYTLAQIPRTFSVFLLQPSGSVFSRENAWKGRDGSKTKFSGVVKEVGRPNIRCDTGEEGDFSERIGMFLQTNPEGRKGRGEVV